MKDLAGPATCMISGSAATHTDRQTDMDDN